MELDEDLEIDLNNAFETTNPKQLIRNYFSILKQEVDSYSDKYLNERLKHIKNNNTNASKLNEDRLEIIFKRDKMIAQLDSMEKTCLSSKTDKQFFKISASLNHLLDKLTKISSDILSRLDLSSEKSMDSGAYDSTQLQIKIELNDLKKEIFLNRTVFFVRNLNLNSISSQFGNLIVLDFFLDDFEVLALKKQLESRKELENSTRLHNLQGSNQVNKKKKDADGRSVDQQLKILNKRVVFLLKLYDHLQEKIHEIINESDKNKEGIIVDYFTAVNEKLFKKYLAEDLAISFDRYEIDYIEENTFQWFLKLICLDLFMNKITIVETNTFRHLNQLECLILNENKINTIKLDSFRHLTSLTDLYLDSNKIESLHKDIFAGLNSLQKLSLASNQIKKIENLVFKNLSSLIYLNLNNNQIVTIESNTFKGLNNLNSLYLIGNRIKAIKTLAFYGLEKLNKLALSQNQLEIIEDNAFDASLGCLDNLNLKNNQLNLIRPNVFEKLTNLRNLDLSSNQIQSISDFSFKGLRQGLLLNISLNRIDKNHLTLFEENAREFKIFLIN